MGLLTPKNNKGGKKKDKNPKDNQGSKFITKPGKSTSFVKKQATRGSQRGS